MIEKQAFADIFAKLTQELRRGVLVLAALSQLEESKYGYSLISSLAERGLEVEQGTLYPLLRRLEEQGLLESEWNLVDSRPRRYYVISPDGREMRAALAAEFRSLNEVIENLLDEQKQKSGAAVENAGG